MTENDKQNSTSTGDRGGTFFMVVYLLVDAITFIILMVQDFGDLNWWNWVFFIPINFFIASIWPGYWLWEFIKTFF